MLPLISKMHWQGTQREFHNIHSNESCVILGGGRSLKFMDLKKFKGKKIIAINLIPFHLDFHGLDVPYVVITQPRIFVPWILKREVDKEFTKVASLYKKVSAASSTTYFVHQWAKIFNPRITNWWPVPHYIWDPNKI